MLHTILAIIIAAIVFVFGMTAWNYSAAEMEVARARADAIRTEANAQARATVILALAPWGIMLVIGVPITILALKWKPRERQLLPHKEVYFIMYDSKAPRREMWQQMAEMKDKFDSPADKVMVIER